MSGETRDIAFQIVFQQCCKTSCKFLLSVLPKLTILYHVFIYMNSHHLRFSGKLTTYPSPKSQFFPKWEVSVNVDFNTYFSLRVILWLRGGVGGLLSSNLNWSMMNSSQKRVSTVTGSHTVEMYLSPSQVISVNAGLPSVLIGTTEHQKPFLN